jgi:hypothetical protein
MSFQSPPVEGYEVLLREVNWVNAVPDTDPHYWTVADIKLYGRSIDADMLKIRDGAWWPMSGWHLRGRMGWRRTREEALDVGKALIEEHREHCYALVGE